MRYDIGATLATTCFPQAVRRDRRGFARLSPLLVRSMTRKLCRHELLDHLVRHPVAVPPGLQCGLAEMPTARRQPHDLVDGAKMGCGMS